MPITRRLTLLALAATILTGCATTSTNVATVGAYRDSIDLNGRLAVNYQKDGKTESLNGNFSWAQRPGHVDVELVSPLGQTVATIAVTPGSATLTQAGRAPVSATDIDGLTQQALGWPLPVSGLRDWLQGYAVDAGGQRFSASPAHNSVTTRDGWRLRFVEWQNADAAQPAPRVIHAERAAAGDIQDLSIRIVVNPAGQG
ncbi:lipoprotein insertase outer membrane protein LolB [Telluria aromaticivorans]|uniref:Outer-membrane lipoprotein LolB n=1 Tax=Telluria aromaticivorans TaxID=2725995 RepID=A0A7Y2JZK5_9BURK|nr:lipoprotein insertase outer membrane protein LolB [Telluria aromaticivorans]NNG23941.1 outer membrane lipoprotein LolB [Telluria aromaticivorans]